MTLEGIEERWCEFDPHAVFDGKDQDLHIVDGIKARHVKRVEKLGEQTKK